MLFSELDQNRPPIPATGQLKKSKTIDASTGQLGGAGKKLNQSASFAGPAGGGSPSPGSESPFDDEIDLPEEHVSPVSPCPLYCPTDRLVASFPGRDTGQRRRGTGRPQRLPQGRLSSRQYRRRLQWPVRGAAFFCSLFFSSSAAGAYVVIPPDSRDSRLRYPPSSLTPPGLRQLATPLSSPV